MVLAINFFKAASIPLMHGWAGVIYQKTFCKSNSKSCKTTDLAKPTGIANKRCIFGCKAGGFWKKLHPRRARRACCGFQGRRLARPFRLSSADGCECSKRFVTAAGGCFGFRRNFWCGCGINFLKLQCFQHRFFLF